MLFGVDVDGVDGVDVVVLSFFCGGDTRCEVLSCLLCYLFLRVVLTLGLRWAMVCSGCTHNPCSYSFLFVWFFPPPHRHACTACTTSPRSTRGAWACSRSAKAPRFPSRVSFFESVLSRAALVRFQ